jgi:hypothetical protein
MEELAILTITDDKGTTSYKIIDQDAQTSIEQINTNLSSAVRDVKLVGTYTEATKTLNLKLSLTKIGG